MIECILSRREDISGVPPRTRIRFFSLVLHLFAYARINYTFSCVLGWVASIVRT